MPRIVFQLQQIAVLLMVALIYDINFEQIHYVDQVIQEISSKPINLSFRFVILLLEVLLLLMKVPQLNLHEQDVVLYVHKYSVLLYHPKIIKLQISTFIPKQIKPLVNNLKSHQV